jgi:hypothetical protein
MRIGWVAIHRRLINHPLWTRGRFSRGQAWIDLLLHASHVDHFIYHGNLKIEEKRGDYVTSQVALAKRWKWNIKSVRVFILFLKTDRMLDSRTSLAQDSGYTHLTILNYDHYQSLSESLVDSRTSNQLDIDLDSRGTAEGQPRDTPNKGNKGNKKDSCAGFDRFWAAYPKKRSIAQARKAWAKIGPNNGMVDLILASVEAHKKSFEWTKEAGQFIPYPATFLNGELWRDQVDTTGAGPGAQGSIYPDL